MNIDEERERLIAQHRERMAQLTKLSTKAMSALAVFNMMQIFKLSNAHVHPDNRLPEKEFEELEKVMFEGTGNGDS